MGLLEAAWYWKMALSWTSFAALVLHQQRQPFDVLFTVSTCFLAYSATSLLL
ncbi:hypothetical protein GLOTRDRAFT_99569 [Gloeophyllum trabeum ATCC 11539]|uniref:Uncharacterized protein n=1 Tax=Gloeophyllum trabeum (strain ATCC 11539 / FP-39264 / Madison 617) TaxID=670483 RepID=S7Q8F9_GLOTA|nr:uncharacterized protein GLOTRDRAFT_99569 [Gloeophyllum trabeum ATCC 11539]EPQ56266.1 hypothetical protein GLOTRDRAFT_99569 [Gloeophyllum trabeum ATCC 11539]